MSLTLHGGLFALALLSLAALLVSRRQISRRRHNPDHASLGPAAAAAAIFLLIVGIGAATTYLDRPSDPSGSTHLPAASMAQTGAHDGSLEQLVDYARSVAAEAPANAAVSAIPLPDVNTMIERLAARLATTPDDIKGWQMLGWSYFHTGHYQQAADAYAKALAIDPDSDDLRRALDEAAAKAGQPSDYAGASTLDPASPDPGEADRNSDRTASMEARPPSEHDAAIRSMVDGLAARLESAPRDVDGWTRLIRSRAVLGDTERAAAAFRRALDVFKDDSAASGQIMVVAVALGLAAN